MSAVHNRLKDLFFSHVAQTSHSPLGFEIERAEGVFLYDCDGAKIIDLISGVSVSNVGHSNKEVVEAVCRQVNSYMHLMVYGEIIEAPQVEHAALLTSTLPPVLDNVYYLNSGSEAVETALKLAKRHTGRDEMVSFVNAYHGSTHGALSMMGSEVFKSSFRPLLPGIIHLEFNNFEDLHRVTERTACVLIEPVQAEGGVILPVEGYLAALRKRCDETGALLIFDEIQTGFGRTGKLFALNTFEVVPDILILAKALGGGMPLGAVIASCNLMKDFLNNPVLGHITTFGGHPVCCAAALAALKILMREKWIDEVAEKSAIFVNALKDHPKVKEVRAAGLLMAVDLGYEDLTNRMLQLLAEEGVLGDGFLFCPTAFRISPPLSISNEEIFCAIERIMRALNRL